MDNKRGEYFQWSETACSNLQVTYETLYDRYSPQAWLEAFRCLHPNFTGGLKAMNCKLNRLHAAKINKSDGETPKSNDVNDGPEDSKGTRFVWDDVACQNLLSIYDSLQLTKEFEVERLLEEFKKIHPKYMGGGANLENRRRKIVQQNNGGAQTPKASKPTSLKYFEFGNALSATPIFKECCHNCGYQFFRDGQSEKRFYLTEPLHDIPKVGWYFPKAQLPTFMDSEGRYVTCKHCEKFPSLHQEYSNFLPGSEQIGLPDELSSLERYEKNQVALCGVFNTIIQLNNDHRKKFQRCQGHFNVGAKLSRQYFGTFATYYNIDKEAANTESRERIRKALLWLKANNPLYKNFLSNYETLYGFLSRYLGVGVNDSTIDIVRGRFEDLVGKEKRGVLLPANDITVENAVNALEDQIAVQHPIAQKAFEDNKSMVRVNYSDPDIEAKAWPCDHPVGVGSWRSGGSLPQREYWKWRSLGADERFRRNMERHFFTFDRYLKEALIYYNKVGRTVNVKNLQSSLLAEDIREQEGRYGSVVPTSIPGSRSYWMSKTLDLLAMTKELGTPTLFVTLTQNDNWPELQIAAGAMTEQEFKNRPLTDPPTSGIGVSEFAFEAALAFHQRFSLFKSKFMFDKNGPFGHVTDYWYRLEYQERGAVHVHILLWIDPETFNEDCVMAEVPRASSSSDAEEISVCQNYVKGFQLHNCLANRCLKTKRGKTLKSCKYGFPFDLADNTTLPKDGVRYLYKRTDEEDRRVVPYNLDLLLLMQSHVNVQRVTARSLEQYLTKYVSKPESSFEARVGENDVDRFLQYRVVGILEVINILMQFQASKSSTEVRFIQTEFESDFKMLKRKEHLPADDSSTDVYYGNKLDKYLDRPMALKDLTLPEMWKQYNVSAIPRNQRTRQDFTQATQLNESINTLEPTQLTARKLEQYDVGYLRYQKRTKPAIPRWRLLFPYGDNTEKFYEQLFLLKVPIHRLDLPNGPHDVFSASNVTKTFTEECAIRKLLEMETDVMELLYKASVTAFNQENFLELVNHLVNQQWVAREEVEKFVAPFLDKFLEKKAALMQRFVDESEEEIEELVGDDLLPLDDYKKSMTPSQLLAIQWFEEKLKSGQQILAIVSGDGGVGKSYFLKALRSLFKSNQTTHAVVAPSASAAFLVGGTTIHNLLRMDITGKCYLEYGTTAANIVKGTEAAIMDEFGMCSYNVFDSMNSIFQAHPSDEEYQKNIHLDNLDSGTSRLPFGGRHIILIGDPAQLESVDTKSIFSHPLLHLFSVLTLKEIVRQKDEIFSSMLRRIRMGNVTDEDDAVLTSRLMDSNDLQYSSDCTVIVPHKTRRDYWNNQYLEKCPDLHGDVIEIDANDFYPNSTNLVPESTSKRIDALNSVKLLSKLRVRIGAVVRLTYTQEKNPSLGWPNGMRCKVIAVGENRDYIIIESLDGKNRRYPLRKMRHDVKFPNWGEKYTRVQFPIQLAFSCTVHGVQGCTCSDKVYIELDEKFWASGQGYCALSRATELNNIHLLTYNKSAIKLKEEYLKILQWMELVDEIGETKQPRQVNDFPLIEFIEPEIQRFPDVEKVPMSKEPQAKIPKIRKPKFTKESALKTKQPPPKPPKVGKKKPETPDEFLKHFQLVQPASNWLPKEEIDENPSPHSESKKEIKTVPKTTVSVLERNTMVNVTTKKAPLKVVSPMRKMPELKPQSPLRRSSRFGMMPELSPKQTFEQFQSVHSSPLNKEIKRMPKRSVLKTVSPRLSQGLPPEYSYQLHRLEKSMADEQMERQIGVAIADVDHDGVLMLVKKFASAVYNSVETGVPIVDKTEQGLANSYCPWIKAFIKAPAFRGIVDSLRSHFNRTQIVTYDNDIRDKTSSGLMPAVLSNMCVPVSTTGDGNCFYHAVSLNLEGREGFGAMLKLLLAYEIAENELYWRRFLQRTFSTDSYEQFLYDAFKLGVFANQNHIWGMSKLLKRPIHVYGQFSAGALACNTKSELASVFRNDAGGNQNCYLFYPSDISRKAIIMHHMPYGGVGAANHFVAMLRQTSEDPPAPPRQQFVHFRNGNIPRTFGLPTQVAEGGGIGSKIKGFFNKLLDRFFGHSNILFPLLGGVLCVSALYCYWNSTSLPVQLIESVIPEVAAFKSAVPTKFHFIMRHLKLGSMIDPKQFAQEAYSIGTRILNYIRDGVLSVYAEDIGRLNAAIHQLDTTTGYMTSQFLHQIGVLSVAAAGAAYSEATGRAMSLYNEENWGLATVGTGVPQLEAVQASVLATFSTVASSFAGHYVRRR